MPVFITHLETMQSTASGFLTKTAQSALGLNISKGLRFNQPNTGPVTGNAQTTRGGEVLQYPLDLGQMVTVTSLHFKIKDQIRFQR